MVNGAIRRPEEEIEGKEERVDGARNKPKNETIHLRFDAACIDISKTVEDMHCLLLTSPTQIEKLRRGVRKEKGRKATTHTTKHSQGRKGRSLRHPCR